LRPVTLARRAASAALSNGVKSAGETADLTIVLSQDDEVRELNRRWRGRNRATNVLSFPMKSLGPDGRRPLGDVILAFETIAREAKAAQKPLGDHLSHLVVHGVLHLMGYNHKKPAEARRMEGLEVRVLAGLGIPDPYADLPPPPRLERR
jgi:probable rRNA maturation factor